MREENAAKEQELRLGLFGDRDESLRTFNMDFNNYRDLIPSELLFSLITSKGIFTETGFNADDFHEITTSLQKILRHEINAGKAAPVSFLYPTDLYLLFLSRYNTSQIFDRELAALKAHKPKISIVHYAASISLIKARFYMEAWLNKTLSIKESSLYGQLEALKKNRKKYTRDLFFPYSPIFLTVYTEIISSNYVALHAVMAESGELLKIPPQMFIRMSEQEKKLQSQLKELENKKYISSESGRVAVIEGRWRKRSEKLSELKPRIDALANQGLKHHKIAERLVKEKDKDNGDTPVCVYSTSKGMSQRLTQKELRDFIKKYFRETHREHLIHG